MNELLAALFSSAVLLSGNHAYAQAATKQDHAAKQAVARNEMKVPDAPRGGAKKHAAKKSPPKSAPPPEGAKNGDPGGEETGIH